MDKKIYDLIISLRLGEKRVKRLINKSRKEEKEVYDEMINALLDGDKETAREYAKEILKIRSYRNSLQKYWSRIRGLRADLEKAAMAKELKSAMVNAAKKISKILEKIDELNVEEAAQTIASSHEIFNETLSEVPDVALSDIDKEEIEEILKIAETEGIEKVKEMFPTPELEEENEELEEE